MKQRGLLSTVLLLLVLLAGCVESGGRERSENASVESCMLCHNGSKDDDYAGPGLENPHPFPGADRLTCTVCHGGNGDGNDKDDSHVPPPPQIGDRQFQAGNNTANRLAYFNRLTLAGLDKFPDYTVDGQTYSALDYLQFIAPSDLRVIDSGRACGMCHDSHVDAVTKSPIATEMGIFSGAMFAAGVENHVPANRGLFEDTAADLGFRAVSDSTFDPSIFGSVANLLEFPVYSDRNNPGPDGIRNNPDYDAANLPADLEPDGSVKTGSPLANLYHEQIAFTCGDCHLGSSGANNRYGDYRGSGCAACHMPYSLSGRSTSNDPNVNRMEPYDPDDIDEPELPHIRRHLILSTAKTLPSGESVEGIDDYACAGCHQGSNRTVMQYWGIRLDQNQDVRRDFQYPANPVTHRTTSGDRRLFDPDLQIYDRDGNPIRRGNNTFNGRNRNQYLLEEDYDGDGRDDTPPDVHYEAGLGCIDCHGSYDLHGGDVENPSSDKIVSRMEHAVAIRCESCHGAAAAYAATATGTAHDGQTAELAVDDAGIVIDHVVKEADGHYYLYSRLTGNRHFVPQTMDTVVNSGKTNPFTGDPLYSAKASYAMGRDDGNTATGLGPQQTGAPTDFSHGDTMDCASCHASWTNTCMGCHLKGEYRGGNEFSNITGREIVFEEDEAQFVYQSPVFMQLGVNARNKITQTSSNTKMFFQWEDRQNNLSQIFTFSDRKGKGSSSPYASLGHNAMMAHSIRGKVSSSKEGPRYCVACHLTTEGLTNHGTLYAEFKTAMAGDEFDKLDFDVLRTHFGQNPGNQLNSPLWVHMVAGLGTGLFLFDDKGCAVNPLDDNPDRYGCFADAEQNVTVAPSSIFDPATFMDRVAFNLDRIVNSSGVPTGSSNHALIDPGPNLRDGAPDPNMAGPLGATLIRRLTDETTGIVLDSWLDANGEPKGGATGVVE